MTVRRAVAALAVGVPVLLLAAGCGDDDRGTAITVLAAASLTGAFTDLAAAFEEVGDRVQVDVSFGASSTLREQALAGAPADVFAAADQVDMAVLVEAGAIAGKPVDVATNTLAIAVPDGNPAEVTGLADFGRDDLVLGLCAPEVPCGRLARRALVAAGVEPSLDTVAADVRALLTQVGAGELDAAVVYRTDVRAAADDVDGVALRDVEVPVATIPVAVVRATAAPDVASAFVAFVASGAGRAILARHGFGPP